MSGFLGEISKATKAMDVYRKATQIIGNNISHASNPDYARQIAEIKSHGSFKDGAGISVGLGIDITEVLHLRNENLDNKIVREASAAGSLTGQHMFAKSAEIYFESESHDLLESSDNASKGSVSRAFTELTNAFHGLSSAPNENSKKTVVISSGKLLVDQVNKLGTRLAELDGDIADEAKSAATRVNGILESIGKLNEKIARFETNNNQKALEDRDLRQSAFESLAEYINFETEEAPNTKGVLNIVVRDASNNKLTLVDRDTVSLPVKFDGTNLVTDASTPVAIDVTGGKIHGYIKVRADFLTDTRTQLDKFAEQLVTSFNSAYNPTSSTGDFFNSSGITATTLALDPTLSAATLKATDTSSIGANELAIAVAELSTKEFSSGSGDVIDGTFVEYFTDLTVSVGQEVSVLEYKMDAQGDIERAYKRIRDDLGGVSLDEEVTETMKMQRVIQGLAYYIKTIEKMLEYIIDKLG